MTAPDERLEALLSRAFHRARATEANAELDRLRKQGLAQGGAERVSYEILVPREEPMRYLVERALPKLVYFLDCQGASLTCAPGFFASLFVGDELYCLHAADLVADLSSLAGLSVEQMAKRWGAASV